MTEPALPRPEAIKLIMYVDGTLLTSSHECHPRTIAAIQSLRQTHPALPIVICSGKQYNSTVVLRQPDVLNLSIDMPALHCHGCIVYGKGGKLVSTVGLKKEAVKAVVNAFPRTATFLFTEDEAILVQDDGEHDWVAEARKYDSNVSDHRAPADKKALLDKVEAGGLTIVKVTLAARPERADAIMQEVHELLDHSPNQDLFSVSRAIASIIEIGPRGVNKGTALRKLCESLSISTDEVLAFGDGENDEPLLATAGFGVAMANGMAKAKAAARYETLSNDEGGVGAFLERIYGPPAAKTSSKKSKYKLGQDEAELRRLDEQHVLFKETFGGRGTIIDSSVPVESLHRVLDIATGTGAWLVELFKEGAFGRHLPPNAEGLGVDIDLGKLAPPVLAARKDKSLTFEEYDVTEPPRASWRDSFDLVHIRLLVCGLGIEQYRQAMRHAFMFLKPGGYLQVCEAEDLSRPIDDSEPEEAFVTMRKIYDVACSPNVEDVGQMVKNMSAAVGDAGFEIVSTEDIELPVGKAAARKAGFSESLGDGWARGTHDAVISLREAFLESGGTQEIQTKEQFDRFMADKAWPFHMDSGYYTLTRVITARRPG